ncbi:SDR family NAD(P)-dependent oxidoreductase [Brooklawnia sp.]|uniref:SDR family NAD(P)-dependent oxidoreductase n=1 Tax=Brooklawnia sp. TaxID=2699740 RepID=UPI00311F3CF6
MSERQSAETQIKVIPFTEQIIAGRFADKTVIVTGAASGIGRATALRIAKEGGRVIASDISSDRLQVLVADNPQLNLVPVVGSISVQEDVDEIVEVADANDDLYGLVNNAGIMDNFQTISEVSDDVWERVFGVNVWGTMRMTRATIPYLLEKRQGAIVNLSSAAGLGGGAAGVAYTASKHAVIGMTKNTAIMYGPDGIRCNAVAPGGVITNIGGQMLSARAQERIGAAMLVTSPGVATPEALAATITWLLSPDAGNVNGAVVSSDGGWKAF